MTVRNLVTLNAALAAISGVALLVIPEQYVQPFGIALDASGLAFARMYGTGLLGVAVFMWLIRDLDADAHRAGVAGSLVSWVTFTIVIGIAITEGIANSLGVMWVGLGILMSLGFAGALAGVAVRETAAA